MQMSHSVGRGVVLLDGAQHDRLVSRQVVARQVAQPVEQHLMSNLDRGLSRFVIRVIGPVVTHVPCAPLDLHRIPQE